MKRLIIVCLLLAGVLSAQDRTPYKFIFAGNSYYGPRNASAEWMAERYDAGIAGTADWPLMYDSIFHLTRNMGKEFWGGPYASSQEINLYSRFDPGAQYNDRLADAKTYWPYVYAKHYLDSIGVSPESLVVHISDNYVSINNDGDGSRSYSLTGLPYPKRRFTYQYWNNTPSDTMFYPAGYCWLANGYNRDARNAIAYAYRRHLLEDSASNGPGDFHWNALFMDNQYREGYAPRLYSYYDINSTSGGPTTGLDWYEQPGIGNDISANTRYYDYSTMLIDSTIEAVLDSACDANGLQRIRPFANVDKFSDVSLGMQIRHTNVSLENPVDYAKAWPNGWQRWYAMADTMAAHPDRYISWGFLGDFLCSSDPSDWRYDSSRIYMTHYAFFLQVRDTNAFFAPSRFNDTTRWRGIYEVDLGEPVGRAYEVSSVGTNYSKIAVMRRDYDNGNVAVLVRTSHGQADWVHDSVAVNVHGLFYSIDADGNASARADSVFYMKPYMGKILRKTQGTGPTISNLSPSNPGSFIDSTSTFSFTASAQSGLDSLEVWLVRPNSDTLLLRRGFISGTTGYNWSGAYTWAGNDCGFDLLSIRVRDKAGAVSYLPEALTMTVASRASALSDAVDLVNYIYRGGPAPVPYLAGDANCDGILNIGDPVYIIYSIFRGGPPICCPLDNQ